ncbi:unnamed protein product, partial [Staurois parvus]
FVCSRNFFSSTSFEFSCCCVVLTPPTIRKLNNSEKEIFEGNFTSVWPGSVFICRGLASVKSAEGETKNKCVQCWYRRYSLILGNSKKKYQHKRAGTGRADIVNAGSRESGYSECRIWGERI